MALRLWLLAVLVLCCQDLQRIGAQPVNCTYVPDTPAGAVEAVARINCGSTAAVCGFEADRNFYGNCPNNNCQLLTDDFQRDAEVWNVAASVRRAPAFHYKFPAKAGTKYLVRVGISEPFWDQSGRRASHVRVNDVVLVDVCDPILVTGGKFKMATYMKEWSNYYGAPELVVHFSNTYGGEALAATVEVYDMGPIDVLPPALPALVKDDISCSTLAPPGLMPCAAQVSDEEIVYGWGAYWSDPSVTNGCSDGSKGSWSEYDETRAAIGTNTTYLNKTCCRACRWNGESVAAYVTPPGSSTFEIPECPPCVAAYYEWRWQYLKNTSVNSAVKKLADYRSPHCPTESGWVFFPPSNKCYFKANEGQGGKRDPVGYISGNRDDASRQCVLLNATLVRIRSAEEDNFWKHGLLWAGRGGEIYTGLVKPNGSDPRWELGNGRWWFGNETTRYGEILPEDAYSDWINPDAPKLKPETGAMCGEYLPQKRGGRKPWNPFSCEVNKAFGCERIVGSALPAPPSPRPSPPTPMSPPHPPLPPPSPPSYSQSSPSPAGPSPPITDDTPFPPPAPAPTSAPPEGRTPMPPPTPAGTPSPTPVTRSPSPPPSNATMSPPPSNATMSPPPANSTMSPPPANGTTSSPPPPTLPSPPSPDTYYNTPPPPSPSTTGTPPPSPPVAASPPPAPYTVNATLELFTTNIPAAKLSSVLQQSVASYVGVAASDVSVTSHTASSRRRRLSQTEKQTVDVSVRANTEAVAKQVSGRLRDSAAAQRIEEQVTVQGYNADVGTVKVTAGPKVSDDKDSNLSKGAIGGIVVGTVVAAVILVGLIIFVARRRRSAGSAYVTREATH